ncbi:ABC transporter transmembrane domain-containing protein [Alphaproteobacteria bacterium]|nr:ABC transporter transmembrane domain-containing protein [Alphaproteobacteria bacterium]
MSSADNKNSKEVKRISALKMVFPYIIPYKLQLAGAAIALLFAAATVLAMGAGLRFLIDEGFAEGDPVLLDRAVIVLVAVVVLLAGASYARFYLISWVGERVVADLRVAVFNHVIGLNLAFFETRSPGEILSRISTDTTLVQTVVGSSVSVALRNLLLFVGGMVLLIITSPKLTGLVLLVIPFVIVPIIILGRKVRTLSRYSQDRVADIGSHVEEILTGIRVVQAFGHEILDEIKFAKRVENAFDTAVERVRKRALLTAVVIAFIFGAVAVVLWIGGRDVLAGRISGGELSAFVFYAIVVAGSMGALSEVVGELQRAAGAMDRLNELLLVSSNIKIPSEPRELPEKVSGAIKFNEINFYYPSRPGQLALDDFTLEIKPGETVALVGPSGAGKSTVFQLLLRFYDPSSGDIKLDDVSLDQTDPRTVREQIGLVPQDGIIFSENVLENIRYGRPEASKVEIRSAAESANAIDFIEELPDGFETNLGEKGVQLSGGQRQRLAIARAILRDPAVLLLDEATSALDAESERFVQRALDSIMVGRTTLIIAHRLATVLSADRIIVMEKGRVIASGGHDQLLKSCPLYTRLANLQFDLDSATK